MLRHCKLVQVLREASDDSEAFGRVSKQAQALESIAKAFPLTDPQVGSSELAPAASAPSSYCMQKCAVSILQ